MPEFTSPFYNVTGGNTHRAEPDRWTDRGVCLAELGVDCTGATDASTALQAVVDADSGGKNLIVPRSAIIKLGTQINITGKTGLHFLSDYRAVNGGELSPQFLWTGTGGTMFNCTANADLTFEGFKFTASSTKYVDSYIKFDGLTAAGTTPTLCRVRSCEFDQNVANSSFRAISIAPTANSNHENYEISDCDFRGVTGTATTKRCRDAVTNGTTTVTSATANFVAGDVGNTILISYSAGSKTTTISSVTNPTTVVLASAPSFSQTGCTIHTGAYTGTAINQGGDGSGGANAFHTRLHGIRASNFHRAIEIMNGGADIKHYGGGFNDTGIYLANCAVMIEFYDAENDIRAIDCQTGNPVILNKYRITTVDGRADGWINLANHTKFEARGGQPDDSTFPGSIFGVDSATGGAQTHLLSMNNHYEPFTVAQMNFANFARAVSINDCFDANNSKVMFFGLATTDPHVVGELWKNSGVLTISVG